MGMWLGARVSSACAVEFYAASMFASHATRSKLRLALERIHEQRGQFVLETLSSSVEQSAPNKASSLC